MKHLAGARKKSPVGKIFLTSLMALYLISSLVVMTACGGSPLAEAFNEEEIRQATEEVISYVNHGDSESLLGMSTVDLRKAFTEEVMAEVYESIGEGGEFIEILDMSLGSQKDKITKEEFAVAIAKVKYEYKELIYTISFTKQMKLAGLYYK